MRYPATAALVGIVMLTGAAQTGCSQTPSATVRSRASILETSTETVRLKLLDAVTARVITNAEVDISSSNGIVCVRAPCPSNEKHWNGRTDAEGYVVAPFGVLQVVTHIRTPAHRANLIDDSHEAADGAWVVELLPRDAPAELDFHPLDLKLIDEESMRPIADAPVRIAFGRTGSFEGTTNSLGYIFVPAERLLDEMSAARRHEDGAGPKRALIIVAGYRTVETDFAAANRKVVMKRH